MQTPLRLLLIATACGGAAMAAEPSPQGYIAPGTVDLTRILPPAPVKGELRYETDRRVYKAMKPLIGTPRWTYATADVPYDRPTMMRDFSCAAGLALTPQAMPATYKLLSRASVDTARANGAAKDYWKRLRPLWIDKGQTCESKESLGKSYDYPSGHTTKGWTLGLVLAQLLPDRATPILARARAYGESRIVCRVHNASAVDAGRSGASATMAAVQGSAEFQVDLAAARAEIAAARAGAAVDTARPSCAADAAVLEPSVLVGVQK